MLFSDYLRYSPIYCIPVLQLLRFMLKLKTNVARDTKSALTELCRWIAQIIALYLLLAQKKKRFVIDCLESLMLLSDN